MARYKVFNQGKSCLCYHVEILLLLLQLLGGAERFKFRETWSCFFGKDECYRIAEWSDRRCCPLREPFRLTAFIGRFLRVNQSILPWCTVLHQRILRYTYLSWAVFYVLETPQRV